MRKILTAFVAVMAPLGCLAVTLPFSVTAPSWHRVALCTADGGVNIRKAPSTTAPKLVYRESDVEFCDTPLSGIAFWGTRTGGQIQPVLFQGTAPAVSEKPGWVELLKQGPKGESNAWVSSKYCKVTDVTPIKAKGNPVTPEILFLDVDGATYAIYMETDEMNATTVFYVGRVADGKIVCPYAFQCEYIDDSSNETDAPSITQTEDGYTYRATKPGMTEVSDGWGGEYPTPDVHKLSPETIAGVIDRATSLDNPTVVYLTDGRYLIL